MSTPVTYVASIYNVPAYQDTGYAQGAGNLSSYLVALATGSLTLSGGNFPLTADANFGASFGLKSLYYKSRNASVASTGIIRLGSAEMICRRDNLGSNDLELTTNAADQLTYNGLVIATSTGALVGTTLTLSATSNQMVIGTTRTVTLTLPTPASASRTITFPDLTGDYSLIGTIGAQTITGAKTFADQTLLLQETGSTDVITINVAALAASRAYTMPDAGGAASFVMTAGTQTIAGAKTFSTAVTINPVSNQLVFGVTNTTTISATAPAASRTYTIPDVLGAADFVMTAGAQTLAGIKTFTSVPTVSMTNPGFTLISTGTGYAYVQAGGNSTGFLFGQEGSGGGGNLITGSGASEYILCGIANHAMRLGVNNAIVQTLTTTGASVTGTLSSSGDLTVTSATATAIFASSSSNGSFPRMGASNTNATLGQARTSLVVAYGDNQGTSVAMQAGKDASNATVELVGGTTRLDMGFGGVAYVRIATSGHVTPQSTTGTQNFGDATNYWNDISYKTITDRGCLPWCDDGVELGDGRVVSDLEALCQIKKHPTKKTGTGLPRLDYSSFPKDAMRRVEDEMPDRDPQRDENGDAWVTKRHGDDVSRVRAEDGVEMTMIFGVMIGAFKEVNKRLESLEKK